MKSIEHVVVLKRTGGNIDWQEGRDLWWSDLIANASAEHRPVEMNAEDPLFILYTSGSTGKPKGCCTPPAAIWSMRPPPLNTFSTTIRAIFIGAPPTWAGSGHSYLLYGPLACGATTLMFEGVPNWPTPARMCRSSISIRSAFSIPPRRLFAP